MKPPIVAPALRGLYCYLKPIDCVLYIIGECQLYQMYATKPLPFAPLSI